MSLSINLVKYEAANDGKLYETNADLIETAFVTSSLLEELKNQFSLAEKNIFEALGSEDHYSIDCFNDSDVEAAIRKLEEIFLSILKSDGKKLHGKMEPDAPENLPSKYSDPISSEDIEDSISRFRTLTNLINVFKLKHDQFRKDDSAVLKVG
ncbi:hypothetical protein [Endozoicomonas sp. 8E]|uniref:hypothetical protein n=1 Tax=unclassified Endozoicomonas TaxID=2644528 RepID=UPI0029390D8B|nr:hypothetical protein [Endozoicomonas sp. 8E]WOG28429.1 hypothetical protein P6910_01890 [Endozoicomonas sp. 8E]